MMYAVAYTAKFVTKHPLSCMYAVAYIASLRFAFLFYIARFFFFVGSKSYKLVVVEF